MEENDDPYKLLGVANDASPAEIKKAYRKLALRHHPDKQTIDSDKKTASDVFAKIAAAYEILSNEEERKQYDLRKKYGGAPGTRYYEDGSAPSSPTRQTTRTARQKHSQQPTTPSRTAKTRVSQTKASPNSGTFHFSYDPSKVKTTDPYIIFRQVMGKDFEKEFPGATFTRSPRQTVSSPTKTIRRNKDPKVPATPTKSPRTKTLKTKGLQNSDDILSMSKSTKIINHDDGTQETITETTIVKMDGSTQTSRESSRSCPKQARPGRTTVQQRSVPSVRARPQYVTTQRK